MKDNNDSIPPVPTKKSWHCKNCGCVDWVEGKTAQESRRNIELIGWMEIKGIGWVCYRCDPMGW